MVEQWITLPGGERLNVGWKETQPARYEARLAAKRVENLKAAKGARAHCDCKIDLQIRQRDSRHHIAIWSGTGPSHAPDCIYHRAEADRSGRAAYVDGVIIEHDDVDEVIIRLRTSLRISAPDPEPRPAPPASPRPGKATQRQMTFLGLLHLLWEKSGLHYWHPGFEGHRTPAQAVARIRGFASLVIAGRTNVASVLIPFAPEYRQSGHLLQEAMSTARGKKRLLVIGFVEAAADHRWEPESLQISLAGQRGMFLSIPRQRWMAISRTLPSVDKTLQCGSNQSPVAALFLVTAETIRKGKSAGKVQAVIEDGAFTRVNTQMIPVESSHELVIADRLVAERRVFEKPMRFDASRDLVRPDFILRDTGRIAGFPMEVFGMNTEAYRERVAEKRAHYNCVFGDGGWWEWDAASGQVVPEFPLAVRNV